jgi:hypothetical protein
MKMGHVFTSVTFSLPTARKVVEQLMLSYYIDLVTDPSDPPGCLIMHDERMICGRIIRNNNQ